MCTAGQVLATLFLLLDSTERQARAAWDSKERQKLKVTVHLLDLACFVKSALLLLLPVSNTEK